MRGAKNPNTYDGPTLTDTRAAQKDIEIAATSNGASVSDRNACVPPSADVTALSTIPATGSTADKPKILDRMVQPAVIPNPAKASGESAVEDTQASDSDGENPMGTSNEATDGPNAVDVDESIVEDTRDGDIAKFVATGNANVQSHVGTLSMARTIGITKNIPQKRKLVDTGPHSPDGEDDAFARSKPYAISFW